MTLNTGNTLSILYDMEIIVGMTYKDIVFHLKHKTVDVFVRNMKCDSIGF